MDNPELPEEPANLQFLRHLVTVLTAVMIVGILTITTLIVIRYHDPAPVLPDRIVLPDETRPVAFTSTSGWFAVVTADDRILIFDRDGGLLQTLYVVTNPN
ncbi:MAG: hypothetical protein GDA36_06295 [Rhodobacteraceae bacterium]|nr:hypothetical protein [Paracoccaceae bacterium]